MSQEQEDAAKWQMFEKYKKLSARHAALSYQVQQWGHTISTLGTSLETKPQAIQNVYFTGYPSLKDLEDAKAEMTSLHKQMNLMKTSLSQAGMNVDKL